MKNISPYEIKKKKFKKSFMGLDSNEVQSYLNILSKEWEFIVNKVDQLEKELNKSQNEAKELKEIESTLLKTLKRAEETGSEIVENANKDSNEIIDNAKKNLKQYFQER